MYVLKKMGVHDFEPYLIPLGFGVGERRALLHILAKKKQSFHLAILLTCLFKAMFSAFSTCHMITFLLLRVCFFFQGFFWGGRKKNRSKSLHQPVKSPSPSGCGLQRASGARRSGPRAIGDLCRRSKEVSLDNSLGYPWPKEQTAVQSADSPWEVLHACFRHLLEWSWGCWATELRQVLQCSWNWRYVELINSTTAMNICM